MRTFKPFRLEIAFAVPPVLGDYLHLDSLVAAAVAREKLFYPGRKGRETTSDLINRVSEFVERTDDGIFLASTFWIPEDGILNAEGRSPQFGMVRRFTLWDIIRGPAGRKALKSKMDRSCGVNRGWMGTVRMMPVGKIVFWAKGDAEAVKEIVEKVGCIGKHARMGMGKIHRVSVREEDEFPFVVDGTVVRFWPAGVNLPDGKRPSGVKIFGRRCFPYWLPDRELCFAPRPARLRILGAGKNGNQTHSDGGNNND